jgi:hypothetical protein
MRFRDARKAAILRSVSLNTCGDSWSENKVLKCEIDAQSYFVQSHPVKAAERAKYFSERFPVGSRRHWSPSHPQIRRVNVYLVSVDEEPYSQASGAEGSREFVEGDKSLRLPSMARLVHQLAKGTSCVLTSKFASWNQTWSRVRSPWNLLQQRHILIPWLATRSQGFEIRLGRTGDATSEISFRPVKHIYTTSSIQTVQ